jgi:hypothetical protein
VSARSRTPLLNGRRNVPRQQRLEVRNALGGGQLLEQAAQVRIGFELVGARGLYQTVATGAGLRALDGVGEEPVVSVREVFR